VIGSDLVIARDREIGKTARKLSLTRVIQNHKNL